MYLDIKLIRRNIALHSESDEGLGLFYSTCLYKDLLQRKAVLKW